MPFNGLGGPVQAAPARPILSQVQIQKLEGLMADHGQDSDVDPDLAKALGLTKDGEPVTLGQLTMRENPLAPWPVAVRLESAYGRNLRRPQSSGLAKG